MFAEKIKRLRRSWRFLLAVVLLMGLDCFQSAQAQQQLVDNGDMEDFEFHAPWSDPDMMTSGGTTYDNIGYDRPVGAHWAVFGLGPDDPLQDDIGSPDDEADAYEIDFTNGYCPECTISQVTDPNYVASGSSAVRFYSPATNSLINHSVFGNGFSYPGITFAFNNLDIIQPGHDLAFSAKFKDDLNTSSGGDSGGIDIELRYDVAGLDAGGAPVVQRMGRTVFVPADIANDSFTTLSTSITVPETVVDDNTGAVSAGPPVSINAVLFFYGTNGAPAYNLYVDDFSIVNESIAAGDFNGDGVVSGEDLLYWQRGFSPRPLSQSDLADWGNDYGQVGILAAPLATSVPEPTSALVALLLFGAVAGRRRR